MRVYFLLLLFISFTTFAQEDLLKELDTGEESGEAFATFKGTRIINGHNVETKPGGTLEFIFSHRFGTVNSGWYEMYGLDQAYVRIGLDYGITDRLSVSVGRNSVNKTLDSYLKYRIINQSGGASAFPFTVTALAGAAYRIEPRKNQDVSPAFKTIDRLAYTSQLLIARKFSPELSIQLMPTVVHKNAVNQSFEENTQFALGAGGRYKLTRSVALTAEYYHNFSITDNSPYHDVFGFGFDIETGGHVFQLVFTNAIGLTERAFITETTDNFWDGDIRFGFNVTRTFQLRSENR